MKPFLKSTVFSLLLLATAPTYAMEGNSQSWQDLSEYESDMESKGLPRTLIIACGHKAQFYPAQQGDHSHPNSWCVDMHEYTEEKLHYKQLQKEYYVEPTEPHWKTICANEELNIIDSNIPEPYKNNFDIVVVERPGQKTINNMWTLCNAAQMVKVGGELTIDCSVYHSSYNIEDKLKIGWETFERGRGFKRTDLLNLLSGPIELPTQSNQRQFNLFTTIDPHRNSKYWESAKVALHEIDEPEIKEQWHKDLFVGTWGSAATYYEDNGYEQYNSRKNNLYLQDIINAGKHLYGDDFNSDNICKKLEMFSIKTGEKDPIKFCPASTSITMDIGNYLANWGFTDIVALGQAYQPYGKLRTGLVSATKTQETQGFMEAWHQSIQRTIR